MCSDHKLQYYRSLSGHSGATSNFFFIVFPEVFLGLFTYFNYFEACSDRITRLDFVLNMQCHNRIISHCAKIRHFWKNPIKPEKTRKSPKKPDPVGFFNKTRVFSNPGQIYINCCCKSLPYPQVEQKQQVASSENRLFCLFPCLNLNHIDINKRYMDEMLK